jgi:hypothetical protein
MKGEIHTKTFADMEENLGHNAEREIGLRDGGSRGTRKNF